MSASQAELKWDSVSLSTKEGNLILSDVEGEISGGDLVALMGPSGAGKSSLLKVLAGQLSRQTQLLGRILVNGRFRSADTWPHLSAYVPQQIHAHEWQTTREILTFVGATKCRDTKGAEKEVEEMIAKMGLEKVADTYFNFLSGGERVRLGVGIELMGRPRFIFLDEPLSGLDSTNATRLLALFRKLADEGNALIVSIHQPSYKILCAFNRVMLMGNGTTVFSGSIEDTLSFLGAEGYQLPRNTNPAEFFIDTLSAQPDDTPLSYKKRVEKLRDKWSLLRRASGNPNKVLPPLVPATEHTSQQAFFPLLRRDVQNVYRNRRAIFARLCQKILLTILCSINFFRLGVESAEIISLRGAITFILFNELFGSTAVVLNRFGLEKRIIRRERSSGMYSGQRAYFAFLVSELLYFLIFSLPFVVLNYWLIGFLAELKRIVQFFSALFALVLFSCSAALTISAITGDVTSSQIVGGTFNVVMVLYSGVFSNPSKGSSIAKALHLISSVGYVFSAMLQSQIVGKEVSGVPGRLIIESSGLGGGGPFMCVGYVLAMALLTMGLGATILHLKTRSKLRIRTSAI